MNERSDIERLLDASIELIKKDQTIEALDRDVKRLESENRLLIARLHILALRRAKLLGEIRDLPILLQRQAE